MVPTIRSMAAICVLAVTFCCLAAISGAMLGYAMVFTWVEIGKDYGALICLGLGLGSLMSLPVLVVSERRALPALMFGALVVGVVCWLVIWNICWAIVHIR